MGLKLINAAMNRIELPAMTARQAEYFKAGVRALAYELEKDCTPDWPHDSVLVTALQYYADPSIYMTGDVPGHIYAIDDGGITAQQALATRGEPDITKAMRQVAAAGHDDYITHHHDFRKACQMAADAATNEADKSYWLHQVKTLDNLEAQRSDQN